MSSIASTQDAARRVESAVKDFETERTVEEKNEREEAEMEVPDCLCADTFTHLRKREHDSLLSVEDRGVEGLVLLLEDLVSRTEQFRSPGDLHFWEFREFVEMHSWQNPVAMYRFAAVLHHTVFQPELRIRKDAAKVAEQQRRAVSGAA